MKKTHQAQLTIHSTPKTKKKNKHKNKQTNSKRKENY